MGSRSTKIVASPHAKAAASPVAPTQQLHRGSNDTNEPRNCQGHVHQTARAILIPPRLFDDITLKAPTRTSAISRRRYSEPAQTIAMATEVNADGLRHLDAFESYVAERGLMLIDMDYADLSSPVTLEHLSTPPTSSPILGNSNKPEESELQCIGCCTQLPKEKNPKYAQEVIRPCRSCNSAYCVPCVKGMFLDACNDSTRMPPRCCTQIHLHHLKPHLTIEETTMYRSKYEEWSTPRPFYCPIPTCSVFIPERLLPQQVGAHGKRKADSVVGTPISSSFACPKCEGEICVNCRQTAHPGSLCASLDLGVDAETAALLKTWGYKRCPKCSQGLKRMYGCNHMECRCGAHFCWGCMKSRGECGGCSEDEDDDYDSTYEPDEPEPLPAGGNSNDTPAPKEQMATEEGILSAMDEFIGITADSPVSSQTVSRPRNLDGGSAHYWEGQDLHFGDEPNDDNQDRFWDCYHAFNPYTISFASSLSEHPSTYEMECAKCWCTIRPAIEIPKKPANILARTASSTPLSSGIVASRGRAGYRLHGRGHQMMATTRAARYIPPRGLFSYDSTVGTAPHLTTQLAPVGARSTKTQMEPMEDTCPEVVLDVAMEINEDMSVSTTQPSKKLRTASSNSNVFSNPSTTYSVAQECYKCSFLVCQKCTDDMLNQRKTEDDKREAEWQAEEAAAEARLEEEAQE